VETSNAFDIWMRRAKPQLQNFKEEGETLADGETLTGKQFI
jgi:hypothetical protein